MEVKKYQSLVESVYGPVYIPTNASEIDEVIECLYDSMESVSGSDFRLFQAIEIIESWRQDNELFRKCNSKNN